MHNFSLPAAIVVAAFVFAFFYALLASCNRCRVFLCFTCLLSLSLQLRFCDFLCFTCLQPSLSRFSMLYLPPAIVVAAFVFAFFYALLACFHHHCQISFCVFLLCLPVAHHHRSSKETSGGTGRSSCHGLISILTCCSTVHCLNAYPVIFYPCTSSSLHLAAVILSFLFSLPNYIAEVSLTERDRLYDEIDRLLPSFVHGVFVTHEVEPTLVDGKLKTQWSEKATTDCYICGANTAERSKRFSRVFTNNPEDRLALGPSPCHMLVRALEWCIVACTHRDIETRKEPEHLLEQECVENRLKELQVRSFFSAFVGAAASPSNICRNASSLACASCKTSSHYCCQKILRMLKKHLHLRFCLSTCCHLPDSQN